MASERFGTKAFPTFLRESKGITPLNGLSSARKARPGAANQALMAGQRVLLRSLMRTAAKRGVLPWQSARQSAFIDGGAGQSAAITIALDEELDGDDAFESPDLMALLAERRARMERDAATKAQVHEEMVTKMDTGVRVNAALVAGQRNRTRSGR